MARIGSFVFGSYQHHTLFYKKAQDHCSWRCGESQKVPGCRWLFRVAIWRGEGASGLQASRLTPAEVCVKDGSVHRSIAQTPILESLLKKTVLSNTSFSMILIQMHIYWPMLLWHNCCFFCGAMNLHYQRVNKDLYHTDTPLTPLTTYLCCNSGILHWSDLRLHCENGAKDQDFHDLYL